MEHLIPLFDFSPYVGAREETLDLIRQFAAHDAFRSAQVEELELDEDFYRRPLRPEDLAFLQFKKPVRAETVSRLPSLASQRLLLSLNEVAVARLPRDGGDEAFAHFDAYYSERNQVLGARIRPFLENYAFDFAGHEAVSGITVDAYGKRLVNLIADEKVFWAELFELLQRNDYLLEGLRFILIQRWCLAPSRRVAVARAAASGFFDAVAPGDQPRLATGLSTGFAVTSPHDTLLARAAQFAGVAKQAHSYWQFYLPTSLAKCNLLYALSARPNRAFALLGAAYAAEAEALAFNSALVEACPHLLGKTEAAALVWHDAPRELSGRFQRALAQIETHYGVSALGQFGQGWGAGEKLAARARWDLGEQLRWLSRIEQYCQFAKQIALRVALECPDIDRETFIEPREMCSTTHVHNDHRLVVIESGEMIFWGNLGMQLKMNPGDMVLIPDGRLHGSTVVSDECTYHQPIIPDDWIAALSAAGGAAGNTTAHAATAMETEIQAEMSANS